MSIGVHKRGVCGLPVLTKWKANTGHSSCWKARASNVISLNIASLRTSQAFHEGEGQSFPPRGRPRGLPPRGRSKLSTKGKSTWPSPWWKALAFPLVEGLGRPRKLAMLRDRDVGGSRLPTTGMPGVGLPFCQYWKAKNTGLWTPILNF